MSIQSVRNSAAAANRRASKRVYDGGNQLRVKATHGEGRTNNFSREGFLADGMENYEADDAVEGTLQAPDGKPARFKGKVIRASASSQAYSSADKGSDGSNPNS